MSIAISDVPAASELDFDTFGSYVARRFAEIAGDGRPLFTVEMGNPYTMYLDAFDYDPVERQVHTCNCCRNFLERYGNLVSINDDGSLTSVMFGRDADLPEPFRLAAHMISRAAEAGKVTGVFVSDQKVWGTPITGEWHHFAVTPNPAHLHRDRLLTPYQVMAQKVQDFGTLSHGLSDFNRDTVAAAINLLEADAVYRAEKVIGPARFLLNLHDAIAQAKGERRRNLIWRAVATAPVGFATPRSSMVGTLLEDIAAGMALESVKGRFAAKMHPLQYQRPQAAPRAGNIEQAEKIVERLGIAASLKRRFARLDEVKLLWSPKPKEAAKPAGGVFGHLRQDTKAPVGNGGIPTQTMTWVKFAATVLPNAETIKVLMAHPMMTFVGVLTAVDPTAPPILQWDDEADRNPVSWYVWHGGSSPAQWGLKLGDWVDATGIMLKPSMWSGDGRFAHHGNSAVIILKGAIETKFHGLAIFPEILKSDLHSIRSTIEAFSKAGVLEGAEKGSANGLMIGSNGAEATIRVTTALGTVDYKIDRWD